MLANMYNKTIYVNSMSDLEQISDISHGIIYINRVGGIANQLYSLISSILIAEVLDVPFICIHVF